MNRSRLIRHPRRHDNPDLRRAWAEQHLSCACCGRREGAFGGHLENHHIVKRGRIDDPRCLLRLCFCWDSDEPSCHYLAEGGQVRRSDGRLWPTLSLANCLHLKRESDPENFDPTWLAGILAPRRLPVPEALPVEFLEARRKWT